jgi:hypothetical protein
MNMQRILDYRTKNINSYNKIQSYFLGFSQITGASSGTLVASPEDNVILQDLFVVSNSSGLVDDIRISGQSVNCSNKGIELLAFSPKSRRNNYFGIELQSEREVAIDLTLDTAGNASAGWAVNQIGAVKSINSQIHLFDKLFGLDKTTAVKNTSTVITAEAVRAVTLRELVLWNHTDTVSTDKDLFVTSIKVSGKEMLTGKSGFAIPLALFAPDTKERTGLDMDYPIQASQPVSITVKNTDALTDAVIGGMFYCSSPKHKSC